MPPRYVFVTGGVVSGLGKGAVAASIGKLLQARGWSVSMVKLDGYFNPDPGTMNPVEHGEIFVTEEVWEFSPGRGVSFRIAEIDQDFGTYERFLGVNMHPSNNVTSGQVMLSLILGERRGEYLGQTLRLIPHLVMEVRRRIEEAGERGGSDVVVVEQGGTVGDYEASAFLETIRQMRLSVRSALVHVTYVPYLRQVGELKTKPTQTSVRILQGLGLQPDGIVARSDVPLTPEARRKIALYSNVPEDRVFEDPYLDVVYRLPLILEEQGMGRFLEERLELEPRRPDLDGWREVVERMTSADREVSVAMVGKYWKMRDVHISIVEALRHAGAALGVRVRVEAVDSEGLEGGRGWESVDGAGGILLTPGFGSRGTEGIIAAAERALEGDRPTLGICFGAQLATAAFARARMGWAGANSTEVDPGTPYPVVDLLPEQRAVRDKGGTMRLGAHEVVLLEGTKLREAYGRRIVRERFRHRYHIVREYAERMEGAGYRVAAVDGSGRIVNAFEVEDHPYMVGVQFHPEYKSRPWDPSPTYLSFLRAVVGEG